MGEVKFDFDGEPTSKASFRAGRIFIYLFATPFAAFGIFAVWSGGKKMIEGKKQEGLFIGLFGLVFVFVGVALIFAAATAAQRKKAAAANWVAQTDGGNKLWLARSDWAAGKIKSSSSAPVKFFLIWSVMALALSAPAILAIPKEWQKGNHLILLALIFPVSAAGLLGYSLAIWRSRRRFGDCFFELAQVPAPLGGTLDGLIQTGVPLKLEQGLHLKLSCIQRTVSGSRDHRSVQESILWQDEKVFRADASLPVTGSGGSGIPVHFNLPANQPESSLRGETTVTWRLEARAKMAGPDFAASFEVPVFRVTGTVPAVETDSDPTAPLQMSAEEIRRDEHSKIQVTDGPNGREFYFPAARNPVPAIVTSTFGLLSAAGCGALIIHHVSYVAAGIVGLFAVIFGSFGINLLFKSSRVTVNSSGVTLQNRWLFFTRIRRFDSGEIVRFDTKVGMTSWTKAFHDLKLVTRASEDNFTARKARYQQTGERPPLKFEIKDPTGVTLASGIASKPEADWLVKTMTASLGR